MPYTFGYGQQKTKPQEDVRNIAGTLNRGFTQEYKITPQTPTITQKTTSLIPKSVLKGFNSDSPLVKAPLLPVISKVVPTGFGKETDRLRKRFLDSASFGITGEADTSLGKDISYRDGRSFKDDALGASLDLAATLAGYAIPGLGWAKAAKAIGLGAKEIPKLISGATKLQQAARIGKIAGQQAKEGLAVGAAIGASEVAVREAINPDNYSAKDNIGKIAIDTLSGAILDPIAYGGFKGASKLISKIKKQPEAEQVIQEVENLKKVPEVLTEIRNVNKGTETVKDVAFKLDPTIKLPTISKKPVPRMEFVVKEGNNIGYRSGTFKPEEISETSGQQSGGRGTGHFGTGHYFFGSEKLAKEFRPDSKRPISKINLENLNLFKPKNEDIGFDLHNTLKQANNKLFEEINIEDSIKNLKQNFESNLKKEVEIDNISKNIIDEDIIDTIDNEIDSLKEEIDSGKIFSKNDLTRIKENFNRRFLDKLEDNFQKYNNIEITEDNYNALQNISNDFFNDNLLPLLKNNQTKLNIEEFLSDIVNVFKRNGKNLTAQEIENIKKIIKVKSEEVDLTSKEDSISTKIMKMLGYDGVDVRGFEKLDNSQYGSVIYSNVEKKIVEPLQKITTRTKSLPTKQVSKEKELPTTPSKQIAAKRNRLVINKEFKEVNDKIKKIFLKDNQQVNGSTLRYPISVVDIRNPERFKGRYGQPEFSLRTNKVINENEYFTKKEIIRLSDIIKKTKQHFKLNYSTRDAKKGLKGAYGYYSHRGQIRIRAYDNIQTFFHELGHYLSYGKYNLYEKFSILKPEIKNEILKETEKYIKNRGWEEQYPFDSNIGFQEGLAEFLRRYMFYPEFEPKDSPAFFKLLNDNLSKDDAKVLIELQKDIKKFLEQNIFERAESEISFGENKKREFPTFSQIKENTNSFLEKFYTFFVDEQRPIDLALKPYGERGEKVFREFRLIKGVGGKARQWLEIGVTNDKGEIIFPSLTEIMKPVEKNYKLFVQYIINKRAKDLIDRGFDVGNKLTDKEREILVDILEKKFPEFIKAQEQLVRFQQYVLAELVKAEKITFDEFTKMSLDNPNYVPFYRDWELDELTPQQAKSYGVVPALFKLKGSTREIVDPIESIVKNLYSFLYVAEKNKLLRNFVSTIFSTTDSTVLSKTANLIEEIKVPVESTKITLKEVRKQVEMQINEKIEKLLKMQDRVIRTEERLLRDGKITKEEFDKNIEKIETEVNLKLQALGGLRREFDYTETANIFRPNPDVVKNRGNIISVTRNNGKKIVTQYYQIKSKELYDAIVASDTRDLGFVFNALNIPTRLFRTGITATFEFWFKNLFRDQFAYAINSKSGYVPYVDLIRGMFHVFGKSEVYQKFLTSGAEQSFRSSLDRNYLKEDIRKIIKDKSKDKKMNVITKAEEIITIVERLSQFVETSSKVGNLAKGLKKFEAPGKTEKEILKEAALDSRDLMDFSRRGLYGKKINAVSAFFNSAVQGLDKTVRVFKDPATRNKALAKGITYITLPTIFLYIANRENPKYQELQDWDKDLFWHFWVGDTHFRLPIPFELGVMFKVIPERILSTLDQNDKPWSGFGKTALNTFNFIPSNPSNGFGITLLSPIIQAIGNTNYFGAKIVPMREQFLPPEEKFGYNTSESAKLIAKMVSKLPGYRDVKMLEIIATPRYVDNIVQGYFGTLGQYGLILLDAIIKPSKGLSQPFPEIGTLPGFKAFLAPQVTNTKSFDEFYNEMNRLREEYNVSLKNNTPFLEKEKKNIYERAAKVLQEFSKTERLVQQDTLLSPIEKKNKILEIHKLEVNFIRQFLGKPLLTNYSVDKNN